ncbi:MAG: hypothetical protein AAF721_34990 [Myxococcota bacterium]
MQQRFWLVALALAGACTGNGGVGDGQGDGSGSDEGTADASTGGGSDETSAASTTSGGGGTGADSTGPGSTTANAETTSAETTGAETTSADTTGDQTQGSDTSSTGGDDNPGIHVAAPYWARELDGLVFRSVLAPLAGDQLALATTGGLYSHLIELGVGGEDLMTLPTDYTSIALSTVDANTGEFLSARMLAQLAPSAPYGMSFIAADMGTLVGGSPILAGYWVGTVTMFPGTADAHTAVALQAQTGQFAHSAQEPLYVRFDEQADVVWHRRGRTPAPLTETWFNTPRSVHPMPDGGLIAQGSYGYSGFIFPDGTPGETTFTGNNGSYFARLDADGDPIWMSRNTGHTRVLAVSSDGAMLVTGRGGTTIFADAATPVVLPGVQNTDVLVALDLDGVVSWMASVEHPSSAALSGGGALDDGTFVLRGRTFGETTTIVDAEGTSETLEVEAGHHQWLLALDGESGAATVRLLPDAVQPHGDGVADGDRVWMPVSLHGAEGIPLELELKTETVSVPDLGWSEDPAPTLLVAVDAETDFVEAQLLGDRLGVDDFILQDGGATLIAKYLCDQPAPSLIDDSGEALATLPTGCDNEPNDEWHGVLFSTPLGG